MPNSKTTLYLIGDAGHDEIIGPGIDISVPSGVLFLREALPALLGEDDFDFYSLISDQESSAIGPVKPTQRKCAELKEYEDHVLRIATYGPAKTPEDPAKLWLHRRDPTSPSPHPLGDQDPAHEILVAHHAGATWSIPDDPEADRQLHAGLHEMVSRFKRPRGKDDPRADVPSILVNLSAHLPELKRGVRALDHDEPPFESQVWNALYERRDNVAVVTSVSTLRAQGIAVSRRLSWEQGVEDLTAELHLVPRLCALTRFRHLFVRVGMVGFIHIQRNETALEVKKLSGEVYFAPHAKDAIHRDREVEGHTIGKNALFIAALVRAIREHVQGPRSDDGSSKPGKRREAASQRIREAMKRALDAMRAIDDRGYDPDILHADTPAERSRVLIASVARGAKVWKSPKATANDQAKDRAEDKANQSPRPDVLSCRPIPDHLLVPPPLDALRSPRRWHILDDVLLDGPVHRINVAMAMVRAGYANVLNCPWSPEDKNGEKKEIWKLLTRVEYWNARDRVPDFVTLEDNDWPTTPHGSAGGATTRPVLGDIDEPFELNVPITTFGELTLIERDETESLRGIRNLLELYHRNAHADDKQARATTPISIAVFGPPGSGKSFAVKQIARAIGTDKISPILEFNVTQFRGINDLHEAFRTVQRERERTPHKTPLVFFDEFDCAWENSELGWLKFFLAPMQDGLFENGGNLIGPTIFVFAGGVYPTFERFDPTTDSAFDNRRDSPEYEQRVKVFTTQKGPDFTSRLRGHIDIPAINDAPGRIKHFIRRAIQLRGVLDRAGHLDKSTGMAMIDDSIVYAMLTADRYRHGVRSMRAIVEMCTPILGTIRIASLPPRAQLNMHVDAEEFLIRVHRGRARVQPEWEPNPTTEVEWAVRTLKAHLKDAVADKEHEAEWANLRTLLGLDDKTKAKAAGS
jgi:hypothetical protein